MNAMDELRTYARGYLAGQCAAELDEMIAYRREALAIVALRELGVSPAGAKSILEQARHDAHMTVPDCSEFAARCIGAEMVIAILRQRLSSAGRIEAAA